MKEIKSLISLKTIASHAPTVLSLHHGDTINNPYDIANTFKNYSASIAETMKKKHKIFKKFSDFLSNETSSTIFRQTTDKEEIADIISSLNSNKASGPNSIPYRILFLLKKLNFEAIGRFIQTLFHNWCFSFCTQNCKSSCCF